MNSWHIKPKALALWAIAWLAAASVVVSTTIGAADEPPLLSLHQSGDGSATLNSVTAELESIEASGVETIVTVATVGREADGDAVELAGPAELRLDDGSVLKERRGRADSRSLVLYFEAIPAGRAVQSVVLPGLGLVRSDLALHDRARTTTVGSFTLGAGDVRPTGHPSRTAVQSAESPFGSGMLEVTQLVVAGDEILIAGFTRDEVHESLILEPPSLELAGGSTATHTGTRIGFAEDPGLFEMRFVLANAAAGNAELRLQAGLPGGGTASATVGVQLP